MAVKDVRNYLYTMLSQYIEEKQNLADFEEALNDGNITQEQMQARRGCSFRCILFFYAYLGNSTIAPQTGHTQ